jgi:hypothetical protein
MPVAHAVAIALLVGFTLHLTISVDAPLKIRTLYICFTSRNTGVRKVAAPKRADPVVQTSLHQALF